MSRMRYILAWVVMAVTTSAVVSAQLSPVYVDDSPIAWEMYREAREQADVNVVEAVRLYQELLDEFAVRLLPAHETDGHRFQAVRRAVLNDLLRDADQGGLLERHRSMERAEAQRLHDAGEFERLVLTRPWTQPGLDGLLRITQRHIESARFDAAVEVLELILAHPDLPAQPQVAAFAWFMRAQAAYYTGDDKALNDAVAEVADLATRDGGRAAALNEELTRLLGQEQRPWPRVSRGTSTLDTGNSPSHQSLRELVAEEIWSVELGHSMFNRRYAGNRDPRPQARRNMEQMRDQGLLRTAAPTIVDDAVFINQGHHLMAFDRYTGSPLWPEYVERPSLTIIDRENDHARDLNVITVEGNALVTLTGHAHVTNRSNDGRVLCLNASTGEVRWTVRVDRLVVPDSEIDPEGLFPHSAPVIAEGKVLLLARKVSPQSLTSTYLLALDLEDGSLLWARHIASSGSIRRAPRAFSTLVYEDGDVYINTAVGAIAKVSAATGQTRWLYRYGVPLNPTATEYGRRPWELDAPVVSGRYVLGLVPGNVGEKLLLVLDRETGHEIAAHTINDQFNAQSPMYLMKVDPKHNGNDGWLYLIGRNIRAYHLPDGSQLHEDVLSSPVWTFDGTSGDEQGAGDVPIELRGRVHAVVADSGRGEVEQALIVPVHDGVLILDGQYGDVLNHLSIDAGNSVLVDAQLFIADDEQLRSYMSMSHAVSMLKSRIESSPTMPEPSLALLRLSSRHPGPDEMDVQLLAYAAEAAMKAINALQEQRDGASPSSLSALRQYQQQLFDNLCEIQPQNHTLNGGDGETIFALMRQALGQALAVRDPESGDAPQVQRLIQALTSSADVSGDPGTHTRVMAARLVDYLLAYGDWSTSVADERARPDVAVEPYLKILDEPLLREVRRREGDVVRPGRAWAARRLSSLGYEFDTDWPELDSTTFDRAVTSLPRLGDQGGDGMLLEGAMPHLTTRSESRVTDRKSVLVFRAGEVHLIERPADDEVEFTDRSSSGTRDSSGFVTRWSASIGGTHPPVVLKHDEQRVLLWLGDEAPSPRAEGVSPGIAVMIDARDGRHVWSTPRMDAYFAAAGSRRSGAARTLARGGNSERNTTPADVVPLLDDERLYLVHRSGSVAAFRLDDGSSPQWVAQHVLEQVDHAELGEGFIVVAGPHRGASRDAGTDAAVAVLKNEDGSTVHPDEVLRMNTDQPIAWLLLDESGWMLCGSADGIEMWDARNGEFQWMNVSETAQKATDGWFTSDRAVIRMDGGELRSVGLRDGRLSQAFEQPAYIDDIGELRQVIVLDNEILAHYTRRIVRYGIDGMIVGTDIVAEDVNYRWMIPASDRTIVVASHQPRQRQVPGRPGRQTLYTYRLYVMSDNGRLMDEPIELPALQDPIRNVRAVDDWLMLSTAAHTIAVPFPNRR